MSSGLEDSTWSSPATWWTPWNILRLGLCTLYCRNLQLIGSQSALQQHSRELDHGRCSPRV